MTKAAINSAPATTTAPSPKGQPAVNVKALVEFIERVGAETVAHEQVIDKSQAGVAKRIARQLNKTVKAGDATLRCEAHRFWTSAHVLAYAAKNGS